MEIVRPDIEAYCTAHSLREDPVLEALAAETRATRPDARMLVGPHEGALLRLLVRTCGARRVLEIGTFTGYSALCMASGLPEDGELVTLDIDPVATAMARRYWEQSPHGRRIRLVLGPAVQTLGTIEGPFDFAFLDADKQELPDYWEAVLPKVRPGGLIAVDNVLWGGSALTPDDEDDRAIAGFNRAVAADPRVEAVMLPVRDGVTVAVKRGNG